MILSGHDSVCSAKNVTARNPMLRRNVTAWSPIILNEFGHCYVVTARRRAKRQLPPANDTYRQIKNNSKREIRNAKLELSRRLAPCREAPRKVTVGVR